MNLLSLFSGIGAFEKALDNEGIKYNLVNYCEIDKYAAKAYCLIHNVPEEKNLKDVTKIETSELKEISLDLITYGFPCQDISSAGLQRGFTDSEGNLTRSGLFFEALRIIKDTQPKFAIAENVKALTFKKFENEFKTVLTELDNAGYNNYYKILNAKDFGIPQNRERIFIVSIRKDIDIGSFKFPKPQPLKLRLKDLLQKEVDPKFYLNDAQVKRIYTTTYIQAQRRIQDPESSCFTLCARDYKDPLCVPVQEPTDKIIQVGNTVPPRKGFDNPQEGRIYDPQGLSPTLNTRGGNRGGYIIEPKERFFKQALETLNNNDCKVGDTIDAYNKRVNKTGICPTLTTRPEGFKTAILPVVQDIKIRKLTPTECWRLMGFEDQDVQKCIDAGISNAQLYKMAGNSIVVTVLQEILKNLFKNKYVEE